MSFRKYLEDEISKTVAGIHALSNSNEYLTIDLHCHDKNSDVPDEQIGRILNVPETWATTEEVVNRLKNSGTDVITITNHNNARSCYDLQKNGFDTLIGGEFSCIVPDFGIGIHVLAYGFSLEQEKILNEKKSDLYSFLKYTKSENIPTIWAHPLFYYSTSGHPPIEFFEKLSIVFERFEGINGQRNDWQNFLTIKWVQALTKEKIIEYAKKFDLVPEEYCIEPYQKVLTGGSDCHMGIFAGKTGTKLFVQNLTQKIKQGESKSKLVLQAIRDKQMVPYGVSNENERGVTSFLDYFCQIAINMEDPGLLRMLLHKGDANEKLLSFFLSNGFAELKKHRHTMRFLKAFHSSLQGKQIGLIDNLFVSKEYRPIAKMISLVANVKDPDSKFLSNAIYEIYQQFSKIFYGRLKSKSETLLENKFHNISTVEEFISAIEIPASIRSYLGEDSCANNKRIDIKTFLDGLSFPLLAQAILYGAFFASTKVLSGSRTLQRQLSTYTGSQYPKERVLWFSDTFDDKNGVSKSLRLILEEIQRRDLPIDIAICSNTVAKEKNLVVFRPNLEFAVPFYKDQLMRIPDLLEIHNYFHEHEYTKIISSTEGFMGLASLLIKNAFNVPSYAFLHTDWIMFFRKSLKMDIHLVNRSRRLLRAYYHAYDGLFVLNSDHKTWLSSNEMEIGKNKICQIGHWTPSFFTPEKNDRKNFFGLPENSKIMLYVGRVSKEKGVHDLKHIYDTVKKLHPDARLVIVGKGPEEKTLKESIPDLIHLGWANYHMLPKIYSSADILLLPSLFDTFGRVVIEAMSCGLPVAAYNTMGPKDIIYNGLNGILEDTKESLSSAVIKFFSAPDLIIKMKEQAIKRSKDYSADKTFDTILQFIETDKE